MVDPHAQPDAVMQPGETRTRGPDIPVEQFLVNLPLFSDLTTEEIERDPRFARRLLADAGLIVPEVTVPDIERLRTCTG